MQEYDSHKTESPAPSTSIPVMSDVKPADSVSVSPAPEPSSEMATPPKDDVMPDLASESDSSSEATPAYVAPAAPAAADAIKKKNGIGMVIGVVVCVVVVLSAVGYFAFMKKDKTATKTPATSQSVTTAKADPAAASSTIDSNLSSLDEAKDFNSADLSDTNLGL